MRVFLYVFLASLIPVTFGIALLLILYFSLEYSLAKAISIGALYSLIPGTVASLLLSIAYTYLKSKNSEKLDKLKLLFNKKTPQLPQIEQTPPAEENLPEEPNTNKEDHTNEQLILLMDKELTFEIIMHAAMSGIVRTIVTHNLEKGTITIKSRSEFISLTIQSLTQHTSEVIIESIKNSTYVHDLIDILKGKEQSLLRY